MLTKVSVIFSLCESDMKPYGFLDILFAINCPQDNITMRSIISLRSNKTRRKANRVVEMFVKNISTNERKSFFPSAAIYFLWK